MCGIAGLVHWDGTPVPPEIPRRMGAALEHRGPDDCGVVSMPEVASGRSAAAALVSQRLSIVDRAGGHQPIANEDRTVWTILNGEIYNYVELREALERRGHRFTTRSDTEVIVHAYEQWHDAFIEHLDGMFALALWDDRGQRLILGRDRFGKKPLVYVDTALRFAFASELQALACLPGLTRTVDLNALGDYLAYMAIPAPATIFKEIRKLPPGHMLVRDGRGTCLRRYWELSFVPKRQIAEADAVQTVRDLLRGAVRKRLMGEVPLGAFLSGGVDSSAVVATMAELSSQPVRTFSIGFEEAAYNELPYARQVARQFGTEHHEFVVRPDAIDVLPRMVRHFGEPYADSSAIPTWYLSMLTRGSVTVALNGDGGDEIFGGYGRHAANALAERWASAPGVLRRSAERVARLRMVADAGGARFSRFAAAAGATRQERYRAWAGVFSPELVRELATTPASEPLAVAEPFNRAASLDAVDSILAVDTAFYLPTDLLPKVDITSMAHSLEVRSPLLDTALAEFVATLPADLKIRRLKTKYILKQSLADRLPRTILQRPKRGFAVPIGAWFRGELQPFLRDHLQPSRAAGAGWLRQPVIDRLITDHADGRHDYAHHLWVLLMLELWYRACLSA